MERAMQETMDEAEQFRQLQAQLRDRWQVIEIFDNSDNDILVIPSLSLDQRELRKISGAIAYEERLLFSLIRLKNPRSRVVYVTSVPLSSIVIDYYLHLLPGIPLSHARDRLLLFSTDDASLKPLTQKLLERPRLLDRIRQSLRPNISFITCYNSTPLERDLSLNLNIPLLGLDPDLLFWGTKSGSRLIFAECGLPHPDGSSLVWSVDDLAMAAAELWERNPGLRQIVIKLNQGFSGEGNAILKLQPLQHVAPGSATSSQRAVAIREQFPYLHFQAAHETWENYGARIPELGAIAEAFISGACSQSPSVQGRINPTGEVEVLSTHDQILGGPDGQIFLGCRFPADVSYRMALQEWGLRVGENLAAKGALERYSVDFMAVRDQPTDPWQLYAIEINLRKGGTTHPFMTLKYLTKGKYNVTNGLFYSQHQQPKYYVATDNLQSDRYQGLLPHDLIDIIACHQLHFDSSTETGTVFHLMGCLSEFGKLGLTSIGNSPDHAQAIYDGVIAALDQETQ